MFCTVSGFKVITFKNPYLGNTCVPFQHWACSLSCAKDLEVPARLEQIAKARELDSKYNRYVKECQRSFQQCTKKRPAITCLAPAAESDIISSCNTSLVSVESSSITYNSDSDSIYDIAEPVQSKRCTIM